MTLPAARLGQRTAGVFVATPARRDACATHLTPAQLGFYLNETGLHAMHAGDLATARDYLTLASSHGVTVISFGPECQDVGGGGSQGASRREESGH